MTTTLISVPEEINQVIQKYGNERDALNVVLARLQTLQSRLIEQDLCPSCYGFGLLLHRSNHLLCSNCSSKWLADGRHTDGHVLDMRKE